ncbi:superfamily II DNA/RNA helicase, SNF2 family [Geomicrobium sp. JCM 19037]|uniref:SNF2 helicase associated domain-containing protein n=1 Tax=Geomicrobium sp. JCM 19037 TaxID=1460634 RepID=UPI00045F25AF|nr:SNF2 helicase associated domain-containing protein [Geomicrobium sp. JCM 19037]GAK03223.1 superfamily II DNA/RNA helicase, SNF2 family [Geomicrobium sp. JCM 19037]
MAHSAIEEFIRTHALPATIKRGKKYVAEGRVRKIQEGKDERYTAVVLGQDIYDVSFTVGDESILADYDCTCPAFNSYGGVCKHIVAVLYQWGNQTSSTPAARKKTNADPLKVERFIDSFADLYDMQRDIHSEREPLRVEYHIHFHPVNLFTSGGYAELELKAGIDRAYVVKHIFSWLQAVHRRDSYPFTKSFTYRPMEHTFTETDKWIMEQLIQLMQYKEESFIYAQKAVRRIHLPGSVLIKLLEELDQNDIFIYIDEKLVSFQGIENERASLPLQFHLDASEDGAEFELEWKNLENIHYLGSEYEAFMEEGVVYFLDETERHIFERMYKRMKREQGRLVVPIAMLERFLSYILPQLEKIANVDVTNIADRLVQVALTPTLFVEGDGEQLQARLQFRYGDREIDPYQREEDTKEGDIVLRDIQKEQEIMSVIENIPFTYNENGLTLSGEESIAHFLLNDVQQLQKDTEMQFTESVKDLVYDPNDDPTISIEFNSRMKWLDIDFQFADVSSSEAEELLQAMRLNRSYTKLSSGKYVDLSSEQMDDVRHAIGIVGENGPIQTNMNVPLYKAFQLNNQPHTRFDERVKRLIDDVSEPGHHQITPPEPVNQMMRDYQRTGFQWLSSLSVYGFGGILATIWGSGKRFKRLLTCPITLERMKGHGR